MIRRRACTTTHTSFRIIKPFVRLGEATVNTVLATVWVNTLYDVDQSLVVPVLNSVDNKVDATISVAFTKLYEGQKRVVRTKNETVHVVSSVSSKTGNATVQASKYTTNKVVFDLGMVFGVVSGAADYRNLWNDLWNDAAGYVLCHVAHTNTRFENTVLRCVADIR
ncbi:hypothetical protein PsorP6_015859 [Peronosclerospora sorghi]|uniref:Uncharacterized protein n=1 Tax=Peronosclerospora sorghi TaxID=230839 RepID=A0ACC0WPB9_9STRA|nr:hypothetical protein PsorP6_015859 [Peronosclerospora sorghi]